MIFFPVGNVSTDPPSDGENSSPSEESEDLVSPGWRSYSLSSSQDAARIMEAAAANAVNSPRPVLVCSSQDEYCSSPLKKLQDQVSKALKGFSQSSNKGSLNYNPEALTKQKRQWTSFRLQTLRHNYLEDPSKLFENIVAVGLPPNFDVHALRRWLMTKKNEVAGRLRFALSSRDNSLVDPNFEPQVLFAFPPEKQLPLKYRDLLSFCFPGGVEVHAVERNSSMSELNEILLGQEHLKHSELSFVFRLQVPDSSPLYGCCVLMEELLDKPSHLISTFSDSPVVNPRLDRFIFTTKRCYCVLSRLPFFELHFGVLNRLFMEERLERLTRSMGIFDQELAIIDRNEKLVDNDNGLSRKHVAKDEINDNNGTSQLSSSDPIASVGLTEIGIHVVHSYLEKNSSFFENDTYLSPKHVSEDRINDKNESSQLSFSDATASVELIDIRSQVIHSDLEKKNLSTRNDTDSTASTIYERNSPIPDEEPAVAHQNPEAHNSIMDTSARSTPPAENCSRDGVRSVVQNQQFSEPSSSFEGFSCVERHFTSDNDEANTEEASTSGQEDFFSHSDMLEWAKENNHGSLQIICEYYKLECLPRGSAITFHPLEHLPPLVYHRPDERHSSGSPHDLRASRSSLEGEEVLKALLADEEATALSTWAISCICSSLKLEHVLTLFAGALLEKQIVFVSSNLGILSASVLSLIPLIRPYQWQSLLIPVLPNDMLDFLEAPVPYIVGVLNKSSEVQSKLTNAILVEVSKNQIRSPSIPELPKQTELLSALIPFHSKLVGGGYLGKQRPISECTDEEVEAAKGFIEVLKNYLDSLCQNLRSHTITNVQSNDDKMEESNLNSVRPEMPRG